MKTTIVLAVLLVATPAFAQYGGSPGATMQDYGLAPHQRTTRPTHHPARTGGGSHGYNQHIRTWELLDKCEELFPLGIIPTVSLC
jgi:hypothetical protein